MSTDCTADIEHYLRRTGEFIMNNALPTIVETIFWTVYTLCVVLTAVILWRKGFTRGRTVLLALIGMMFLLDTLLFSGSLYSFFYQTREILLEGVFQGNSLSSIQKPLAFSNTVINALRQSMLVLGDCIVIWRAYALWTGSRIIMIVPALFLFGWIVNFPIFVTCDSKYENELVRGMGPMICLAAGASAWVLSFFANMSATLSIFYTAWRYHISQKELHRTGEIRLTTRSKVASVLLLLVESGFAYFFAMTFFIIVMFFPERPYGLGTVIHEVLSRIGIHCVAMVPTVTTLLINLYGSLEDSYTVDILQSIGFANPSRVTQSPYVTQAGICFPASRTSNSDPSDLSRSSLVSLPEDKV
ncbi:hypothetical protein C8J56DRAFT_942107 [Mycena floridula]|nr:hypothetical protein C8J56DRAFT_942107 [Mycena floridula]